MSVIDNKKYLTSILLASAVGVILHIVIDQQAWHGVHSLDTLLLAINNLRIDIKGTSDIWKFVGSGGTLAAIYVWLFEKYLWKIPLLQGWLVRFPNLGGTWVGVLTPRTKAMRPGESATQPTAQVSEGQGQPVNSSIPDWAIKKGVLPIHVTIDHEFDKLTYKAHHPNSTNKTLAQQLVYVDQNKETLLYVVYFNQPKDDSDGKAAPHKGCCKLELTDNEGTKSATPHWRMTGTYWTDKVRDKHKDQDDKGTWGNFDVHWESRKVGENTIDWNEQARFDV